ncbi:MAG: hypothetical protein ACQSGP_08815 [Frankia sp.]
MRRLAAAIGGIADVVDRWLLLLVVAAAGLGISWSGPPRAAVAHHGVTIALVVLVAAVGLGLPAGAVASARADTPRILLAIAGGAVVLPAVAWAASRVVPDGPLRLGVLAAGVAPSEVASVALAALAGGMAAGAAAVLMGSTVASVFLAGPVLHVVAGSGGGFSNTRLLLSLLRIVAAPLAVAALVRWRLPSPMVPLADAASSAVGSTAVLVLIWLVSAETHLGSGYLRAGLALLLYLIGSAALAAVLTLGMSGPRAVSLLLPIAMRDFAIAAGIATAAFGSAAAGALGLYGVLVLLFGAATARIARLTAAKPPNAFGPVAESPPGRQANASQ